MYAAFQKTFAVTALLTWALLANSADGQVFRPRRVVPAQPVPTQPAVTQPAPDQAVAGQQAIQPADATQGRVIRGRSLIGMNILGANQQQVGTIKDFIVDYQSGDCPTIYFAVAPQISGWNGDYVIVPLNAFQTGYDPRQRTDYFTLNMTAAELGAAPRLAADKWNSTQDRRTFANSRQFYQRVERTAARPATGSREERPALPNTQPPGGGAATAAALTRAAARARNAALCRRTAEAGPSHKARKRSRAGPVIKPKALYQISNLSDWVARLS